MSCPEKIELSAFADGELETAHASEIARHVADCAQCRQFVEEMQWLDGRGRAALRAIEVEEPSAFKIIRPRAFWSSYAQPLAYAAAIVGLLSVTGWFFAKKFEQRQMPQPSRQAFVEKAMPAGQIQESSAAAFSQWAEPYRQMHIPLVPLDVAASYNPPPIQPILPNYSPN